MHNKHNIKSKKNTVLILLTAVLSMLLTSNLAFAQGLEEITVTARKRSESLQDVPVAVSALSAGQLERGAVQTVLDVAKLVPNVELHMVSQSGASLGASIRGIGFDDLEKTYEPTVGVSVDGVFMASNSGAVVDFFDIASVEVLRGPQGTLYGRNTIAGVINIKRTEPTGEFGGKVEATIADFDRQDLKGLLNMPIGDKGGLKLAFRNLTQDSHLFNVTNNTRPDNLDSQTATAALKYDFTDNTSALLAFDTYDHNTLPPDVIASGTGDSIFCAFFSLGCASGSSDISEASGYTQSVASEQIVSTIEGDNLTLNVDHEGENFELKYIFGVMDFEELAIFNSWGAPTPLFSVRREQEYKQTSHELQFISEVGALSYVAGLYFLDTESYITSGPIANFTTVQDATATALFGELSYDINDQWTVSLGARYTEEEKELNLRRFGGDADRAADVSPILVLTPDFEDDNLSYRLVAQRNFDKGMVYLSYATGFRSGGFNNRGSDVLTAGPYGSEEVESIEIGLRSEPTDNLQLNVTAFLTDYTDKQQFVVTNGTECGLDNTATCTFVRNAATTSNDGLEFEGVYTPTEALTLRASLAFLDAGFDSYIFDDRDIAADAKVIYAPETTASLTAEYTTSAMGGELTLSGSFSYKDEVFGNAPFESYSFATGPDITIEAHDQLDVSATFIKDMGAGTFKAILYATDLYDEDGRIARAFDAGAFAWQEVVPGRQIGLTLGYEF